MEVLLKQDVNTLGTKDEIVKVRDGYGRNYLIPQGLAIQATEAVRKMHTETLKQRAFKEEKVKAEAVKTAKKLKDMLVKVGAKVGEAGKIFGSVNALQVAESLKKAGINVDRKDIAIKEESIKHVGKYTATVKLHKDVVETISFEVVGE
jgi:large subunit ribosomal protein L9